MQARSSFPPSNPVPATFISFADAGLTLDAPALNTTTGLPFNLTLSLGPGSSTSRYGTGNLTQLVLFTGAGTYGAGAASVTVTPYFMSGAITLSLTPGLAANCTAPAAAGGGVMASGTVTRITYYRCDISLTTKLVDLEAGSCAGDAGAVMFVIPNHVVSALQSCTIN
jgi:hypothetical protein